MVVYGHTPVPEAEWLNRTINIDTGCVFGGRLTALRYPETRTGLRRRARSDLLRAGEAVPRPDRGGAGARPPSSGTTICSTSTTCSASGSSRRGCTAQVTIREENAAAALEVMSRFAADPQWLDLPAADDVAVRDQREPEACWSTRPRRSPTTATRASPQVVCEEKHMGSRAVVIVCRDEDAARRALRRRRTRRGIVLHPHRPALLRRRRARGASSSSGCARPSPARRALGRARTDWVCLDCELMPWSAKAQELLRDAVRRRRRGRGAACSARRSRCSGTRRPRAGPRARTSARARSAAARTWRPLTSTAYRRYCWPVESLDDLQAGAVPPAGHRGQGPRRPGPRLAHGDARAALPRDDALLLATPYRVVDVDRRRQRGGGRRLVGGLPARGGEGMVVKPLEFVARGRRGSCSRPSSAAGASTCGSSTARSTRPPTNLERLRARGLAGEAVARAARVRPGHRGAGALRAERAAVPRPRVRLRRAGAGERAGRSTPRRPAVSE